MEIFFFFPLFDVVALVVAHFDEIPFSMKKDFLFKIFLASFFFLSYFVEEEGEW